MTDLQKIIKYLALAFAVFLAVSIIGGILGAVGLLSAVSGGGNVMEEMREYSVSTDISNLDVELAAAELEIVAGEKLSVSSNLKKLTVREKNGTLLIEENSRNFLRTEKGGKLVLRIPAGYLFREADITTGAGSVTVEELLAEYVSLELGAGRVDIACLSAQSKASIEGGAGKITIRNAILQNLEMDMGIGEVDMTAAIRGKSEIHSGIGNTNLTLIGSKEDYRISLETGIGNTVIDGHSYREDGVYGGGDNRIALDAGIGNIRIVFVSG